jgi:diguanylate cyclase (GGDEF)-like protein
METLDYEETADDFRRQIFDLTTMLEIGKTLNASLSLSDVLDIVKLTCSGHFHASDVHLLLPEERNGQEFFDYTSGKMKIEIGPDHPLLHFIKENHGVIPLDTLKKITELKDTYKVLQDDAVELIVPLRFKYQINGVLCLAKKENSFGARYTNEETRYVDITGGFASVAIENARLYEIATLDRKTGLFNHGFFQNRLAEEIERAERYKTDLSLMILDLDHFKKINDTHGHMMGDDVLIRVAHTIKDKIRTFDIPARFGGEEFTVILPETDDRSSIIVADRLRKAIEKLNFKASKTSFSVTTSIGVTTYEHSSNLTEDMFIEQADKALYLAKDNGRNQVALYNDITEKVKT